MKKKLLLLTLTAIFAFNHTKAQFVSVTDCDANGTDHSIFFINPDTGFVAGEANAKGIIQKTMNGGNTWANVYTSTANAEWVYDIYFANSDTGIAVGESGTILRTIDGGTNWSRQTISNVIFNSVHFPTSTVGYITGQGTPQAPIYKTIDGGMNWTAQVSNADSALVSIFFVNADTGYAVGSYDILKTINGGNTWTRSNNNYSSNGKIYCTDANTCYVSSYSSFVAPMIKTIDGGATWNPLSLPILSPPYGYVTTSVYFTDALTGYATGVKFDTTNSTAIGTIFKTTDAGQTWYNINTTINNITLQNTFLTSIHFVNSQIGYAQGGVGKVLKTSNAGGNTTGIDSGNEKENEMNIYPNPFSSQTTLQTNRNLINATMTVYNFFGQMVKQIKNISGQKVILHRDDLPSGLYFIRLAQDNKIIAADKLVITDLHEK